MKDCSCRWCSHNCFTGTALPYRYHKRKATVSMRLELAFSCTCTHQVMDHSLQIGNRSYNEAMWGPERCSVQPVQITTRSEFPIRCDPRSRSSLQLRNTEPRQVLILQTQQGFQEEAMLIYCQIIIAKRSSLKSTASGNKDQVHLYALKKDIYLQ